MKAGETDYQIFANAMPKEVAQLNDVPVMVTDGKVVFMRDVASVQDSAQIQSNVVRINGRRQVYIPIYRQPGANTIEIVDGIRGQLEQIGQRLREMDPRSKDLALEVVLDQSVYVRDSIDGLQLAALLGALLAGLVVLVFLRSFRSTFIIMLAIPLAVLAAVLGLLFTGQTLNTLTLGGIALAIGILIDQSIVVVENVVRHRAMGKSRARAARDGTAEVAPSIIVSTLTFAAVFLPIIFLFGMARYLFTPLAISATFVMIASLVVAITVVPVFLTHFLPERHAAEGREERASSFGHLYGWILRTAVRWRWAVVLLAAGGAAASVLLLTRTGTELFPRVDAAQFQMSVRLPPGTRIERTEATLARIEGSIIDEVGEPDPEFPKVEKHPNSDLRMIITNIGVLMDWPAAYTPNSGPMDAFVLVQLKEGRRDVFQTVSRLRERLRREFPEAEFAFDTGGMLTAALNFGEPAPIHFQVKGSNLQILEAIGGKVAQAIARVPGAEDVRVIQRNDYPALNIQIDRTKAALAGIDVEDVMHNLVTATNSSINFSPAFWLDERNGNHYFIGAQYAESEHVSVATLLDIPITPQRGGEPVPLRTIATIERGTGPSFVSHRNITRVADVYANVATDANLGDVVKAMEQRLAQTPALGLDRVVDERGQVSYRVGGDYEGRGYTLTASGEIQTMRDSFEQFLVGLLLATLLVYLVMVAQLRSFIDPLMILLTVPLGLIGVSLTLYLTGTTLNIQSAMGIIMMVGIVVEYGIILVHFANTRVEEGVPKGDAIVEAARLRLRPIMMTSLTTVLALVPMALGFGGGEANVPLARAIIGGVLGATALTLVVLPCLYTLMKRPPAPRAPEPEGLQMTEVPHE